MARSDADETCALFACYACRKRKIRCGRQLPHCRACKQTLQQCEYPQRAEKPGPKLGSRQRNPRSSRRNAGPKCCASHSKSNSNSNRPRPDPKPLQPEPVHDVDIRPPTSKSQVKVFMGNDTFPHMPRLSFILHPSHDPYGEEPMNRFCFPKRYWNGIEFLPLISSKLGVSTETFKVLINQYFEDYTSFQLFQKPHFRDKMLRVENILHVRALESAMIAFALKASEGSVLYESLCDRHGPSPHETFIQSAIELVEESMKDYNDSTPPFIILQALILITHWLLIRNAQGKAWRYLGTCVRIAYELNLHMVDAGKSTPGDPLEWCIAEERRRAWWAIWEMDVFASIVRRCPTAINWYHNQTLLPADEDCWFRGIPQTSCYLETDVTKRWQSLERSGNKSPTAWFIVLNSFAKEAQEISNPAGIELQEHHNSDAHERLDTIEKAVLDSITALPESLRYKKQYLAFNPSGTQHSSTRVSTRFESASVLSVHFMAALVHLMINHFYVFGNGAELADSMRKSSSSDQEEHQSYRFKCAQDKINVKKYFDAADNLFDMVDNTWPQYYRYVNPCLANTIWLAVAVQLLQKELSPPEKKDLQKTKFDAIYLVYKTFAGFWSIPTALEHNLEVVEFQLSRSKDRSSENAGDSNFESEEQDHSSTPNNGSYDTDTLDAMFIEGLEELPESYSLSELGINELNSRSIDHQNVPEFQRILDSNCLHDFEATSNKELSSRKNKDSLFESSYVAESFSQHGEMLGVGEQDPRPDSQDLDLTASSTTIFSLQSVTPLSMCSWNYDLTEPWQESQNESVSM